LIDEHNKQRQNLLNLERCWPTRDCWFRLVATLVGMSVVDMHRWYRNYHQLRTDPFTDASDIGIVKFSDMICGGLQKRESARRNRVDLSLESNIVQRITLESGEKTHSVTPNQATKGRAVGTSVQQNCWICRKYLGNDGTTQYIKTQWRCKKCGMPLCSTDRRDASISRLATCQEEHIRSNEYHLCCNGSYTVKSAFPKERQVKRSLNNIVAV